MSNHYRNRSTDRWLQRRKRLMTPVIGILAGVTVAIALGSAIFTIFESRSQRQETIGLLCDHNRILREFIAAEPQLDIDATSLRELARTRCDQLLEEVGLE